VSFGWAQRCFIDSIIQNNAARHRLSDQGRENKTINQTIDKTAG
jgi:hypothetical protein